MDPLILESRLGIYPDGLTPRDRHFVRWHGSVPRIDTASYRLTVSGRPGSELNLGMDELMRMESRDVTAVLECAGNQRGLSGWSGIEGTPWGVGAVSCSNWTGVSVATVLEHAGLDPGAVEVVFTGAGDPPVQRSLPMETVVDSDTIVAWAHAGRPLLREHGAPARLVVPGWYGMAWTKALLRIEAVTEPWRGQWDSELYALRGPAYGTPLRLTVQNVKSVIVAPRENSQVDAGSVLVAGFAWSGTNTIQRVELSIDDGPYAHAQLGSPAGRGWTPWRASWDATPGTHVLRAKATDAHGDTQPGEVGVAFNELGYAFNGTVPMTVDVV